MHRFVAYCRGRFPFLAVYLWTVVFGKSHRALILRKIGDPEERAHRGLPNRLLERAFLGIIRLGINNKDVITY